MKVGSIVFPEYSGIRCLMMPYIQGDEQSVPEQYRQGYESILRNCFFEKGQIGYLTIDESKVSQGQAHRGKRAKYSRALHTEAGLTHGIYGWGGTTVWGSRRNVELDEDVEILLANNLDNSCAVWDTVHKDTSIDGDIGNFADSYPYEDAILMNAGDLHKIGILTPHESLPVDQNYERQFLRIISSGVHGREPHFTENPLLDRIH